MSGSQKKKAEKARRRAEREKAHAEERRRNIMTGIIAGFVVLLGGIIIFVSLNDSGEVDTDELGASAEAAASEAVAAASEDPAAADTTSDTAGEVVPDDPAAEPGAAVDSGLEPTIDDRPVACGAEEPAGAGDTRPQFPGGPAQVLTDGTDYSAVIETSCGTITMDLLEDDAPMTVNSFVFLAQQGFFDGLEIFRNATSIGALQTGGGDQTNSWQIGYSLPDELGLALSDGYPVGSVAMANAGANTGGSQFFFVYNDSFDAAFDGAETFTVFGQITGGLDIAEQVGVIPVGGDGGETPLERVYMQSVTIEEN